jgi:regulator of nonsense transcripts 1
MEDSFDNNYSYSETASQYGGGVLDDTASMISGYTNSDLRTGVLTSDLDNLSISGESSKKTGAANGHSTDVMAARGDDDFDGVLDDMKDDAIVDLPPHACRYLSFSFSST